jgi:hypothetical protein
MEINVTSSTGSREITRFDGKHIETAIRDRIETKIATREQSGR